MSESLDDEAPRPTSGIRKRAEEFSAYRCKNLIAVIEDPVDIRNVGTVVRNVDASGVEKTCGSVTIPHR